MESSGFAHVQGLFALSSSPVGVKGSTVLNSCIASVTNTSLFLPVIARSREPFEELPDWNWTSVVVLQGHSNLAIVDGEGVHVPPCLVSTYL